MPDLKKLKAELSATDSEINRHLHSQEWAYAMGHGCSMDGAHPRLKAIRDRVNRLRIRYTDLQAQIAEHEVGGDIA